jgi:hypothetical protein
LLTLGPRIGLERWRRLEKKIPDGKIGPNNKIEMRFRWWAMLIATIIMFGAALGISITMYVVFSGCSLNVAFITINLLICFLISISSIHPKVK